MPPVRPVVLGSGPYTLAVTLSTTGLPVCQNGFCTSNSLCVNNPTSMSTSFNVDLERTGDAATRPRTRQRVVLVLQPADRAELGHGTIAGSARDANGVQVDVSGAVTESARPRRDRVSGNIDGQSRSDGAARTTAIPGR